MKTSLKTETVSRKKSVEDRVYEHSKILDVHERRLGDVEYDVDELKPKKSYRNSDFFERHSGDIGYFTGLSGAATRGIKDAEIQYEKANKYIWIGDDGGFLSIKNIYKLKASIAFLENAIDFYPEYYDAWVKKGFLLLKIGEKVKKYSEECYEVSEECYEGSEECYERYAESSKYFVESLKCFNKAIGIDQYKTSHPYRGKGHCFSIMGSYISNKRINYLTNAKKYYTLALKINPDDKIAIKGLENIAEENERS